MEEKPPWPFRLVLIESVSVAAFRDVDTVQVALPVFSLVLLLLRKDEGKNKKQKTAGVRSAGVDIQVLRLPSCYRGGGNMIVINTSPSHACGQNTGTLSAV